VPLLLRNIYELRSVRCAVTERGDVTFFN